MLPPTFVELGWYLALLLALLWLVTAGAWLRARSRGSLRSRRRLRTASAAESDAERLVAAAGYDILGRQAEAAWELEVDGERTAVTSRADLLLSRDGELFVADVKSGAEAIEPRHPPTRRQLLEYLLAFDADRALVIDMTNRSIREVSYPGLLEE